MKSLLLIFIVLIAESSAQDGHDASFKDFCKRHDGKYTPFTEKTEYLGDGCTATFDVTASDNEEALQFCKQWIPYHVIGAKRVSDNRKTECQFSAPTACRSNHYKLIWGRCYRLESATPKTRDSAVNACTGRKMQIAKLYRPELTRMWKAFYPNLDKIWVDTEHRFPQLVKTVAKGSEMLAYGMFGTIAGGRGTSVVEVNKGSAKVLCEYVPPATIATYKEIADLLSQFYYHIEANENGLFLRSSNFYNKADFNLKMGEVNRCKSILKVFGVPNANNIPVISHNVKAMSSKLRDTAVFAHMTGVYNKDGHNPNHKYRDASEYKEHITSKNGTFGSFGMDPRNWQRGGAPFGTDDRQDSTVLLHHAYDTPKITDVSSAVSAPMWCGIYVKKVPEYDCGNYYWMYGRDDGRVVCQYVHHAKVTFDELTKECKKMDGHNGGFDSEDEFLFLQTRARGTDNSLWLGLKRTKKCENYGSYTGECVFEKAVEWQNGVANRTDFLKKVYVSGEPYYHSQRPCNTMWRGYDFRLSAEWCSYRYKGLCTKDAVIKAHW